MKARMQKKLLCLLLASTPLFAADKPATPEKGKRIDHGASLGARNVPSNGERQLTTETFVLSDADLARPASQPLPPAGRAAENPPTGGAAAATPGSAPASVAPVAKAPVHETRVVERATTRPGERTELAPSSFVSGGSELGERLKARLDELVAHLRGRQNLRIEVIGHTDTQRLSPRSRAKYRDNQGLGLARADIVAAYLGPRLGLAAERIATASRGPDQPLASNDTPEGMAQNRRVEIRAWYEDVVVHREEVVVQLPPVAEAPPAPEPSQTPAPIVQAAAQPVAPSPLRSCDDVLASRVRAATAPFRISIDGVPQEDTGVIDPDIQRCTDVALEKAEVQIRYDTLEQTPVLNAHAWPNAVARDGQVEITGWSNYQAFIAKAEVRLFAPGVSTQGIPLAVLPADLGQPVAWSPKGFRQDHVNYVLRVYDRRGRFDETRPRRIDVGDKARPNADFEKRERELLAGYGENSLAIRNIQSHGGAVTANGSGIKPGEVVTFLGQPVPVDAKGAFAARQILPAGNHVVEVEVKKPDGAAARYSRNLAIAADDWFYLGLADITLGRNATSGPARLVTADATDHFDNQVYVDGRLAFYLKGKVKGEWLLTASADTREQPLKSLFTHFHEKDPRYLLRSLDPDKYYPVYGDDSTAIDDAPTQGRFFVRLARGDSQVMWGSFKTSLTGTEFANFSRTLYGARAKLVSDSATKYGEKRGNLELFGADPGTLQSREEFRGTGGSLYYLHNLDITPGSERVWVEVRDKDTGLVLKTQSLVAAQDYEVNAIQGRITLREPLASTVQAGTLVQSGDLSGHPAYLLVTYEYAPGVTAVDKMVVGGRASTWVNDHVQIGASGFRQDADAQRQRLKGIDATLRYKPGTYVKLEGARSEGVGTATLSSLDGGFSFLSHTSTGAKADAKRVEAGVDFAEIRDKAKGKATVYWQDREAGFSGPGQIVFNSEAMTQQGASLAWQATDATELKLKLDEKDATSQTSRAAEMNVNHVLNPNWKAGVGLRADDLATRVANASSTLSQSGRRSDAVARLDYTPDAAAKAGWSAYGYAQGTLEKSGSRNGNDRFGLGGERRVNDRFKLTGEVSDGDGGFGARVGGDWQVDDRSSLYTNYTLTPDRTDEGFRGRAGLLTAGGKTRFNDTVSLHAEERYQHGDGPSGLIHAFGLDLSPDERWNYGLKLEAGRLSDPASGDLDRQAVGLSVGYRKDATRYAGALEYRDEKGIRNRQTWLLKNTLGYQVDPDWRFLGRLNYSTSSSSGGAFFDGEYLEVVTGYAWRPVKNDRWNTLFKYTYLYNLPSPGQVSNGWLADFAQKSHVLAVDTIYDVRPWVSVGGKLGARRGELKDAKVGGNWHASNAWLGILRADWHWVHEWDILTELRMLDVEAADDRQAGALVGVYKHLGKHAKLGLGYNFTRFSDDLTDLSYRSRGWFINLIGKM